MAKHVFIYLAVYTLFLQLTRGMVKIFDLIPGYINIYNIYSTTSEE